MNLIKSAAFAVTLLGCTAPLQADPDIFSLSEYQLDEKRSRVWAGFGYFNAKAREIVYGGPGGAGGDELSHLVWDAKNALVFNLGFDQQLNEKLTLFAEGVFSFGGFNDGHMVDYDWLYPTSEWSDRSVHPDTNLDHYYQFDVGFDLNMHRSDCLVMDMRMGFRYTDIAFGAKGGDYIYSQHSFRDTIGSPPRTASISYRQKFPGLYIGPRMEWQANDVLTFRFGALAGVTFNAKDRDHHWNTGITYFEDLDTTAFYGATVGADYKVGDSTSLYVEATHDRYARAKGTTEITTQGHSFGEIGGAHAAGADLRSTQIKAGIKVEGWHKPLFKY